MKENHKANTKKSLELHIGEEKVMANGHILKITGISDLTTKDGKRMLNGVWENGKKSRPFKYCDFKAGNKISYNDHNDKKNHIGECLQMSNGMHLLITGSVKISQNKSNCVLYFGTWEDGKHSKLFTYQNYIKGYVKYECKSISVDFQNIFSNPLQMECGLSASVTSITFDVNGNPLLNCKWEDGKCIDSIRLEHYFSGNVEHSSFLKGKAKKHSREYLCFDVYDFLNDSDGQVKWRCLCKKCNKRYILSAKEMINHSSVCIES